MWQAPQVSAHRRLGPRASRSHHAAPVKSLGSLAGKIVIDCTNPLGMGPDGLQLVLGFDTSAGEQVASWAPDAFVFKTLNTTGASNMARAAEYPVKPLMLVAGDDAAKK